MRELKFQLLALIVMLTGMGFSSCSKDDGGDVTTPENEIEKVTGKRLVKLDDLEYSYDKSGRCVGVTIGSEGTLKIDWNKGLIKTVQEESEYEDGIPQQYDFKTNGKGFITEISGSGKYQGDGYSVKYNGKMEFSYDKSGYLTKINMNTTQSAIGENGEKYNETERGIYTLTWEDGNLVKVANTFENTETGDSYKDTYDYTISYDRTARNVFKQWSIGVMDDIFDGNFLTFFAPIGMMGIGTANFPTSVYEEYKEIYDGREYTGSDNWTMDISTNSDDLISLEIVDGTRYEYYYDDATRSSRAAVSKGRNRAVDKAGRMSLFPRHRNLSK